MRLSFAGLGVQGKYLAINEAQAGFDLMVYDLKPEPLEELAKAGAKIAASGAELGAHGDIVQLCVLNDAQLEVAALGPDGVLAAMAPGTLLVIHSTVRPSTIARIAAAAADRGVEVADVPVSGSERGAREKTMSFMFGGSEAAFDRLRPVLEASGPKIRRVGELGAGIKAKLAHQLMACVNIMSAYEGMKLGAASGVPVPMLRDVVHDGVGQSWMADRWQAMTFNPTARGVFAKDLSLCIEYGAELGLSLPATRLAAHMLEEMLP